MCIYFIGNIMSKENKNSANIEPVKDSKTEFYSTKDAAIKVMHKAFEENIKNMSEWVADYLQAVRKGEERHWPEMTNQHEEQPRPPMIVALERSHKKLYDQALELAELMGVDTKTLMQQAVLKIQENIMDKMEEFIPDFAKTKDKEPTRTSPAELDIYKKLRELQLSTGVEPEKKVQQVAQQVKKSLQPTGNHNQVFTGGINNNNDKKMSI